MNLLKEHMNILEKLTELASKETQFNERGQFMNIQKMIEMQIRTIDRLKEFGIVEEEPKTDIPNRELHSYQGMKYLIGQRGCGHTYASIKVSAEKRIPILVHTSHQSNLLVKRAKELGYNIPMPISMELSDINTRTNSKLIIDDHIFFSSAINNELKKRGINEQNIEFINLTFDDEFTINYMDESDKEFVDGFKKLEKLVEFN
jgi:hypothetical protein